MNCWVGLTCFTYLASWTNLLTILNNLCFAFQEWGWHGGPRQQQQALRLVSVLLPAGGGAGLRLRRRHHARADHAGGGEGGTEQDTAAAAGGQFNRLENRPKDGPKVDPKLSSESCLSVLNALLFSMCTVTTYAILIVECLYCQFKNGPKNCPKGTTNRLKSAQKMCPKSIMSVELPHRGQRVRGRGRESRGGWWSTWSPKRTRRRMSQSL